MPVKPPPSLAPADVSPLLAGLSAGNLVLGGKNNRLINSRRCSLIGSNNLVVGRSYNHHVIGSEEESRAITRPLIHYPDQIVLNWDVNTTYQYGDVVYFAQNGFYYIYDSSTPSSGTYPGDSGQTVWRRPGVYVGASNGYYTFNDESSNTEVFGQGIATYYFLNVPEEFPIAFINKNKPVRYGGQFWGGNKTVEGHEYDFYYGNIIVNVEGDFGVMSYCSLNNGYMGGYQNLVFSSSIHCPSYSKLNVNLDYSTYTEDALTQDDRNTLRRMCDYFENVIIGNIASLDYSKISTGGDSMGEGQISSFYNLRVADFSSMRTSGVGGSLAVAGSENINLIQNSSFDEGLNNWEEVDVNASIEVDGEENTLVLSATNIGYVEQTIDVRDHTLYAIRVFVESGTGYIQIVDNNEELIEFEEGGSDFKTMHFFSAFSQYRFFSGHSNSVTIRLGHFHMFDDIRIEGVSLMMVDYSYFRMDDGSAVMFRNAHGGRMAVDPLDLDNLRQETEYPNKNKLYWTMLHEVGHAFGIGPLWNTFASGYGVIANNFIRLSEENGAQYIGRNAVREYNRLVGGNFESLPIQTMYLDYDPDPNNSDPNRKITKTFTSPILTEENNGTDWGIAGGEYVIVFDDPWTPSWASEVNFVPIPQDIVDELQSGIYGQSFDYTLYLSWKGHWAELTADSVADGRKYRLYTNPDGTTVEQPYITEEIMTPYFDGYAPWTRMSTAFLHDLGYIVDYSQNNPIFDTTNEYSIIESKKPYKETTELITNPYFTTNLNGWTVGQNIELLEDGNCVIKNAGAISQSVNLSRNVTYYLTIKIRGLVNVSIASSEEVYIDREFGHELVGELTFEIPITPKQTLLTFSFSHARGVSCSLMEVSLNRQLIKNSVSSFIEDNHAMIVYGQLNCSGDIFTSHISDERLKKYIKPIDNCLDKILGLSAIQFDWNEKQNTYSGRDIGLIAQQVEKVCPEVVETRESGFKAIRYEKISALIVGSIKESQEKINKIKQKINYES